MPSAPLGQRLALDEAIRRRNRRRRKSWQHEKKAQTGAGGLLSQEEARFPLVPTLHPTLGVQGYRPMVRTWDNQEQVYCWAALNLMTGQLTPRLLEQPAQQH